MVGWDVEFGENFKPHCLISLLRLTTAKLEIMGCFGFKWGHVHGQTKISEPSMTVFTNGIKCTLIKHQNLFKPFCAVSEDKMNKPLTEPHKTVTFFLFKSSLSTATQQVVRTPGLRTIRSVTFAGPSSIRSGWSWHSRGHNRLSTSSCHFRKLAGS